MYNKTLVATAGPLLLRFLCLKMWVELVLRAWLTDISHICNSATCHVYFGWNPILTCAFSSHAGRSWICCMDLLHTLRHWLDNILLTPRSPATLNSVHRLMEAVRVVMQQPVTRLVPTGIQGEKRKNYMILTSRQTHHFLIHWRSLNNGRVYKCTAWAILWCTVLSDGALTMWSSMNWHISWENIFVTWLASTMYNVPLRANMRQKNQSFCNKLTVWHLGQQNSLSFWMLRFTLKHFPQVSSEHLRLPEGFIE